MDGQRSLSEKVIFTKGSGDKNLPAKLKSFQENTLEVTEFGMFKEQKQSLCSCSLVSEGNKT